MKEYVSEGRSLGIREEVGYTEMLTHLVKHTADKPRFLYYITNLQKKVINNQAKKAIRDWSALMDATYTI